MTTTPSRSPLGAFVRSPLGVRGGGKEILFAGGTFTVASGVAVNRIAKWSGSAWSALGSGLNGNCFALAVGSDGSLYVGGDFTTAGGISANRIAKWDGKTWSMLGSGFNGDCYALAIASDDTLYAAGAFTTAGGISANRIAKWDGEEWSVLGTGLNSYCVSISIGSDGSLYASGEFTSPGNYIAKWDGSAWSGVGTLYRGPNCVFSAPDGSLYAGGFSLNSSGARIVKFNGSSWITLGKDLDTFCRVIISADDSDIYLGGSFNRTGDGAVSLNKVAKWDGASLSGIGSGAPFFGNCYSLCTDKKGTLYAGGSGGTSRIVKFDGTSWSYLGDQFNLGTCYAVAVVRKG